MESAYKKVEITYGREANSARNKCRTLRLGPDGVSSADKQRQTRYGITPEQYSDLIAEQQGRCAICKKFPITPKRALAVDHNHKTGRVRGLLCVPCNTFLGKIEKHRDRIDDFLDYLEDDCVAT